MHHRIQPIATGQAVVARGLIGPICDQGEIRHRRQTEGLAGRIHVVVLHIVSFGVVDIRGAGRVRRLCQQRVLNAEQVLGRSLPALVAFESILRVEGRHDVSHFNHAAQNVQAIVGGRHQFDVFNHRS